MRVIRMREYSRLDYRKTKSGSVEKTVGSPNFNCRCAHIVVVPGWFLEHRIRIHKLPMMHDA